MDNLMMKEFRVNFGEGAWPWVTRMWGDNRAVSKQQQQQQQVV